MLTKEKISDILLKSIDDAIPNKNIKSFDEFLISENSVVESIEVAQIIVRIEELISEAGVEGYDLFESLFKHKELSFNSLIDLIFSDLSERE